ncbi:MAG: nucleotidyltransferase family protein [Thermoplasmata archaeon]
MRASDATFVAGTSDPPLAVVVLAAGASERFGGFPKALVRIDGETAVERVVRMGLGLHPSELVVVTGPHRPAIRSALAGPGVRVIENAAWAYGRTGSIQVGLSEVPEDANVLLWPVDHPLVEDMTLRALVIAAHEDQMAVWFIPTQDGRGGHPVLLRPSVRPLIRSLPPDVPLHQLLPGLGVGVRRVTVHDPGVLANVDTPEALGRALAERRRRGEG